MQALATVTSGAHQPRRVLHPTLPPGASIAKDRSIALRIQVQPDLVALVREVVRIHGGHFVDAPAH